MTTESYRGRIAPSPTGYLHLGHARTFWVAYQRSLQQGGTLIYRDEDLDPARSRSEFSVAAIEDLRWLGIHWSEGPDCGGSSAPYTQSLRIGFYRDVFEALHSSGLVYPCNCSRQDVLRALSAPHQGEEDPVYPGTCRQAMPKQGKSREPNWRFRVPDGEIIRFLDGNLGETTFVAGGDFGDFVVWRNDDVPSYQLAVVADDAAMGITEVVRGADLLLSTARQILLYRALGKAVPQFYHVPLMLDEYGRRLAKRHEALNLRTLREQGKSPAELRQSWGSVAPQAR